MNLLRFQTKQNMVECALASKEKDLRLDDDLLVLVNI